MTGSRPTGDRCEFHELHSVDGYTEYRSAYNSAWYLGFNRRGRKLSGRYWTRRRRRRTGARAPRRCRQFLKTNFARAVVVGSPPYDPTSQFDLRRVVDALRTTTASSTTSVSHRHRRHRLRDRSRQRQQQTVRTT